MKVKMIARHGTLGRKLEQGMVYDLPDSYAQELMKHGLAVLVRETVTESKPFEVALPGPGFVDVNPTPPKARIQKIVAGKGKKSIG